MTKGIARNQKGFDNKAYIEHLQHTAWFVFISVCAFVFDLPFSLLVEVNLNG